MPVQSIANWWFCILDVTKDDIDNIHRFLATIKTFKPKSKYMEPNFNNNIRYAITTLFMDELKSSVLVTHVKVRNCNVP